MYNSRNFFLTEVCGASYQIIPSSLMGFSNALIYTTGTSTTLTSFVLGILPGEIHCQLHCTPCYCSWMVKARLGQYTASIEMWPHVATFQYFSEGTSAMYCFSMISLHNYVDVAKMAVNS